MSRIPPELRAEVEKWRSFERERPAHIVPPGPDQESVWDYPRPPRVEPVSKRIRIEFAGIVLADSYRSGYRFRAFRVIETAGRLRPSRATTMAVGSRPTSSVRLRASRARNGGKCGPLNPAAFASFIESANNLAADG